MPAATLPRDPDTGATPVVRRRRRWLRVVGWGAASVVVLIIATVVAGVVVYAFPPEGDTSDADLVYVIGPPTERRLELATQLMDAGTAPEALVISYAKGEQSAENMSICSDSRVTCIIPHPSTTKGEALGLENYAAEHGTQRTIVITVTPHVARTRYIFDKCFDGDVSVVGVGRDALTIGDWAWHFMYQSAAFVKAWVTPCADLSD